MSSLRIPTNISGAYWYDPEKFAFQPAMDFDRSAPHEEKKQIFWFDRLLEGGIVIPQAADPRDHRALTILVTGPPGSGKSTLVAELCYRLACQSPTALRTRYNTTEGHAPWLIQNALSFWGQYKQERTDRVNDVFKNRISFVDWTDDEVKNYANSLDQSEHGDTSFAVLADLFGLRSQGKRPAAKQSGADQEWLHDDYDVVVIDSLNVLRDYDMRADLFQGLYSRLIRSKAKIVIFILDSNAEGKSGAADFWEYLCDTVIRLDRTHPDTPADGYFLRTLEIIKGRYQKHAWGPHQLKIYEAYDLRRPDEGSGEDKLAFGERLRRAHPFREEGGIFIYPSIHYLLSTYKRRDPASKPAWIETPIPALSRILPDENGAGGGFPQGRCTAFLGVRGGHKSHLGIMHVLERVLVHQECALIISLRDDAGVSMSTMHAIVTSSEKLQKYREMFTLDPGRSIDLTQRMEILYFPPGNITPEEFVHRVLLSVLRLKTMRRPITCLFNSLDQLGSRFPLCSKEGLFLTTILQMLSAEQVTSIVVAASEQDEPTRYYGLESIAELILSFNHDQLKQPDRDRLIALLEDSPESHARHGDQKQAMKSWLSGPVESQEFVTLKVVRQAGGQAAGTRALLELVSARHELGKSFDPGLHCFPF